MRTFPLAVVLLVGACHGETQASAPNAPPRPGGSLADGGASSAGRQAAGFLARGVAESVPVVVADGGDKATRLELAAWVDAGRLSVQISGGRAWRLPLTPTSEDLAPILAALEAMPEKASTEVVIAADASLPHGTVVALIDAVRAAGFQRLAIAVEPRSPADPR